MKPRKFQDLHFNYDLNLRFFNSYTNIWIKLKSKRSIDTFHSRLFINIHPDPPAGSGYVYGMPNARPDGIC